MRAAPIRKLWYGSGCFIIFAASAFAKGNTNDAFIDVVTAHFNKWDANHDHKLSEDEIDAAIEDPANTNQAAAAVAAIKLAYLESDDDFLPLKLSTFRRLASANRYKLDDLYRQSVRRIGRVTHRELFASGLPKLETIHQSRIANCFTLGPLGALVQRDAQAVAAMFVPQPNGRVLVSFPGGAVVVAEPTDAELAMTAGNSHDGVWINLYEKAIATARNENLLPDRRWGLPIDAIDNGGQPYAVLSYLTGHKVKRLELNLRQAGAVRQERLARLRRALSEAVAQKRLVAPETDETTTPGLTENHTYALLHFSAAADTVKVWNPFGDDFTPKGPPGSSNGYPTVHGVFTMPVTDFAEQFSRINIETGEPASRQWLDQWQDLAKAGHFAEAANELTEIVKQDAIDVRSLYGLAPLLIESGRTADYRELCKGMLDAFGKTKDASIAERTAKSCLLLSNAVATADRVRVINLASNAVTLSKKDDPLHWRLMTRGLAEYRAGNNMGAIATAALSRRALAHEPDAAAPACEAESYFIEAMARHQARQDRLARSAFAHGSKIVRKRLPALDSGDLGENWFDDVIAYILRDEAKATVQGRELAGVHSESR